MKIINSRKDFFHFGKSLGDFYKTAGLINVLDAVVSIDSGIAHLAGALGQNVELALDKVPDFRWTIEGQTALWYPQHNLHRRDTDQSMEDVFLAGVKQAISLRYKKTHLMLDYKIIVKHLFA